MSALRMVFLQISRVAIANARWDLRSGYRPTSTTILREPATTSGHDICRVKAYSRRMHIVKEELCSHVVKHIGAMVGLDYLDRRVEHPAYHKRLHVARPRTTILLSLEDDRPGPHDLHVCLGKDTCFGGDWQALGFTASWGHYLDMVRHFCTTTKSRVERQRR